MCQEFGAVPSVIQREPMGLLNDVVAWRNYVWAREAVKRAENDGDVPEWALELVYSVEERLHEERKRQGRDPRDDEPPAPRLPSIAD